MFVGRIDDPTFYSLGQTLGTTMIRVPFRMLLCIAALASLHRVVLPPTHTAVLTLRPQSTLNAPPARSAAAGPPIRN
jgi:hypothetical protein